MKVTSITSLKEYSKGKLVELPPFAEGQPFVARLKRPSMLVLMKNGKIPNSLLSTANSLFAADGSAAEAGEDFYQDVLGVIEILAEASFIEPSWRGLKESGVELTDDQYTFIFNYSQRGVKALENFREDKADNQHGEIGTTL